MSSLGPTTLQLLRTTLESKENLGAAPSWTHVGTPNDGGYSMEEVLSFQILSSKFRHITCRSWRGGSGGSSGSSSGSPAWLQTPSATGPSGGLGEDLLMVIR